MKKYFGGLVALSFLATLFTAHASYAVDTFICTEDCPHSPEPPEGSGTASGGGDLGSGGYVITPYEPDIEVIQLERVEVTASKDAAGMPIYETQSGLTVSAPMVTSGIDQWGRYFAFAGLGVVNLSGNPDINRNLVKSILDAIRKLPLEEQLAALKQARIGILQASYASDALGRSYITADTMGMLNEYTINIVRDLQGGFATAGSLMFLVEMGLSFELGWDTGVWLNQKWEFLKQGGGADIIETWLPIRSREPFGNEGGG